MRAAEALGSLAAAPGHAPALAEELQALADWTAGIAALTRGQMAEAVQAFDRAAAGFGRIGAAAQATQTQVPKVMALSMLGRHAEAVGCAERTLQAFIAQDDRQAAGRVSLNLGSLHLRHDDFRAAVRHYREAAVLFARVGDAQHSVMADIGVGDALAALGEVDEARRVLGRARARAATHGFPVLQAMVEESSALLALACGQYREALAGFEASRARYEALAMPQHLAIAEKQLANAYLALRLLPEAQALYQQVLGRFEALDMPEDRAWALAQLGRTLALLGRPQAASRAFEQASAAFAGQQMPVGEAAVALARGESLLAQGRAAEALPWCEAAAQGFGNAAIAHAALRSRLVQADALLAAGQAAAAHERFAEGLAQARQQGWLALEVHALAGLGSAARAQGNSAAAASAWEQAVALSEAQRAALPGEDLRSAFLASQLAPYQGLVGLWLDAQDQSPGPARPGELLALVERSRARALADRLGRQAAPPAEPAAGRAAKAPPPAPGGAPPAPHGGHEQPGRASSAHDRLNWLYHRVQQLQEAGETSAALESEIRETERALLEQSRRQRLSQTPAGDPIATCPPARAVALASDLQQALAEGDALVAYAVAGDELLAIVVTRQALTLRRRLAAWSAVLPALRQLRFQMETVRHGDAALSRHLPRLLERTQARLAQLHDLVWAGLADLVAGHERLLVVAPGALGALPFAALHDGQAPLLERHTLAMAASAEAALHGLARPAGPARSALALGESSRLPQAAAEARDVAARFGADGTALVGPAASVAALVARAAEADVLHLACHARFRSDNPMFSALDLADGALTVEQVQGLRLRPGTVVLSACESGLADEGDGDELVGLVRAFLVAGAARVVASLWPVDDAQAARQMQHFHAALVAGASPAAALRDAQRRLRATAPHPAHWAAFTVHGGW